MKGLEPSTFCMASRRSSQLSYSRNGGSSIARASATMVGVSVARSIVTAAKAVGAPY